MRARFIYLCLFLPLGLYAQRSVSRAAFPRVQVAAVPSGDTIEANYLLEDDLTDEMGNYDGTAEGTLSYDAADFVEGSYSLELDNNDEGSDIGEVDFGTGGFSVSMWHKYANTVNNSAFVLFSNRSSTSGDDGFAFWLNSWQTTDGYLRVYTGDGTNQDGANSSWGAYNNGAWNHLVFVYEGSGTWTIYVDGVDVTDDDATQDDFGTSGTTTVIGNWNGLNYSGDGLYDAVKIYTKALTQDEVTVLYEEFD